MIRKDFIGAKGIRDKTLKDECKRHYCVFSHPASLCRSLREESLPTSLPIEVFCVQCQNRPPT